jgi:hypothetical protein
VGDWDRVIAWGLGLVSRRVLWLACFGLRFLAAVGYRCGDEEREGLLCMPVGRDLGWKTLPYKTLLAFVFCLGLFCAPAFGQLPSAVGWTALPASTSLEGSGACPANNFGGDPYPFADNCQNVIRTWNGAIADTNQNRLILWGGGHGNYFGNEIYSLNLTANPITLTRLKDPTIPTNYANAANCIDGIPPGSPDFAPNARESYGGLEFLPGPNRMMIFDGSLACTQGHGSANTWTISLAGLSNSSSWVHEDPTLSGTKPNNDANGPYGNIAAYDPNSGLVFVSDSEALYTYSYSTNTYNRITSSKGFTTGIYLSGAIDPTRKLLVLVGACADSSCGPGNGVFVADISNPASTTQQNWTSATLADPNCAEFLDGGVNPINASNPGFTFDSVANDFVGWPNQGNSVYIMTPDVANERMTCQKLTFANGPPNSSHSNDLPNTSYGTFGRFRYFAVIDAFVLVNDWNIPPYILRLRGSGDFSLAASPSSQSVTQGNSTSYTVSVGAVGGFSGAVNLAVSGLPSGATASFNPASVAAGKTSTLTVSTAGSTPVGNSTLSIAGTSGSLTHTAAVTLNVTGAANFSLGVTPTSASVAAGGGANYSVSVGAVNGFSGSVGLSVSGLPSGATANFNPSSVGAGASSTLTVTTTSGTPVGNSTLTIVGTSGSLTHTTSVTLSVTAAPGFTLSATPSSASVTAGAGASYTVSVTALNGFSGSVSLSLSGLPSGTTGTFKTNPVGAGASSALSVTTSSSTAAGNYSLTIAGTSSGSSASAHVTLVVTSTAPPPPGSITFVQAAYNAPQTAVNPVTATFPSQQTSGDLNVIIIGWNDTTATISGVSDRAGNTYTLAAPPTTQSTNTTEAMYYAKNIFGADAGVNTVAVVFSVPATFPDLRIMEYAGADQTNPLDAGGGASGTSTDASAFVETTNANDMIVAGDYIQNVTPGAGTGFTSRMITSPDSDIVEDESVNVAGMTVATAPLARSGWWVMNVAAFRVAGGVVDPPPPQGAIAFVQGAFSNPQGSVASATATFAGAQSSGNLNIVVIGWNDTTATVRSVSDGKGNLYMLAAGPLLLNGTATQSIYYAPSIVGGGAGATTVRVSFNGSATSPDLRIAEYTGASTTNPIDGIGSATGTGATASATLSTPTTNADDLMFASDFTQTATTGPGSGFTSRMISSPDSDIVEDKSVASTGTYAATAPLQSGWWLMQLVAIK